MPGSSIIVGIMPIFNHRKIFPTKPATSTYDSEIYIGMDPSGKPQCLNAIIHHFMPSSEQLPIEDILYFVVGKLATINPNMFVGDGISADFYDCEIDAFVLHAMPDCSDSLPPPVVTVSGIIGQKLNDNELYFDVMQYIVKENKMAAHHITIPNISRFGNVSVHSGASVAITGRLTGEAEPVSSKCAVKCLPLEVQELAFLSGTNFNASTIIKGKPAVWKSLKRSRPNDEERPTPESPASSSQTASSSQSTIYNEQILDPFSGPLTDDENSPKKRKFSGKGKGVAK